MGLTLVTGPANAAKIGVVLERLRAALPREPIFVVPTGADVEHYQRELANANVVFGAEVATFARLIDHVARAVEVRGRPIGRITREHLVRSVIADTELVQLKESASSPGFAKAAGEFFAELQRSFITPQRLLGAINGWGSEEAPAYANELALLYRSYRDKLARSSWQDRDGYIWETLNRLREKPHSWGSRPIFFYGFDDLAPNQLDAIITFVERVKAEVCLALPYEPGRVVFADCATTVETLKPLAEQHIEVSERSDYYADCSRVALHHLERNLLTEESERVSPCDAIRLLEAGGDRAQAELVGAEILELFQQDFTPQEVAVVVRNPATIEVFAQILNAYGVPVAESRHLPLSRTRLGSGVLAFARAALPEGTAADLLHWLRTPGKTANRSALDRLDARVRREGFTAAQQAREVWNELTEESLAELDSLVQEGSSLPSLLHQEASTIALSRHGRRAHIFTTAEHNDVLTVNVLRTAANELIALAGAEGQNPPSPEHLLELLGDTEVNEYAGGDGVFLGSPLAIRARRFRAVFVCGLQDGEFPKRAQPSPFFDENQRRSLALATGLVLPIRDTSAREHYLFYACASRPEEALYLAWSSSDEEGTAKSRSPFVDDVRALFDGELWDGRAKRLLADVTWPPDIAPTPAELRRALAANESSEQTEPLASPTTDEVLALLSQRKSVSARELETYAACPVKWMVESLLRPQQLRPDPEPMRRGALAHALMERVLRRLKEKTGSARLTPATLEVAVAELHLELDRIAFEPRSSEGSTGAPSILSARERVLLRGLEVDIRRCLAHESTQEIDFEPTFLEWSFGGSKDEFGPIQINDIEVKGRVDRIDVAFDKKRALVRDYKGRTVHPGATWLTQKRLQVALYMLAAQELLKLNPVGGLYQPIGLADARPRGLVTSETDGQYFSTDTVEEDEFYSTLQALRALAHQAAAAMLNGEIEPSPSSCGRDGCSYPTICRSNG